MELCCVNRTTAVDYKHEMDSKVSVANIHYMTTLSFSGYRQLGQYSCDSSTSETKDEETSLLSFFDEKARDAVRSCDSSDWFVLESGTSSQRESYVNNEELKEVFAQLKSAALSTTNSEVSVFSVANIDEETPAWDTEKWKKYYEANRPRPSISDPVTPASPNVVAKPLHNFFKRQQFNQAALDKIKTVPVNKKSLESDADDEESNSLATNVEATSKLKERKLEEDTYIDHDTWLFQNLTPEEITAYRMRQKLKRRFAPGFISRRITNKLHHTNIFNGIKSKSLEKLKCKFEPHEKFPKFGEGNYKTTAVTKNHTFTPVQQMEINRSNYILDLRLQKIKNKKQPANPSRHFQIRLDQSTSYINRMKEYQKIHEENQKIAKMFNPSQIRTTSEVYSGVSKSSFDIKSSTSTQFKSKIYTNSYSKMTVKKLAHSKNQYAPGKSSDVKKRRPDWNHGHVDYKKPEVKPIQYKSIRKLPVVKLPATSGNVSTKSSTNFLIKPFSAGSERTKSSNIDKKPNVPLKKSDKPKNGISKQTNLMLNDKNTSKSDTQLADSARKSKIPLRRNNAFDLNNEKFKVFEERNKALFGPDSAGRNNIFSIRKEGGNGRNTMRKCREFVDKSERGGGDATDNVLTETDIQNNRVEHQTDKLLQIQTLQSFEKQNREKQQPLLLSSDTGIDAGFYSDQCETPSTTSTISLEEDFDNPRHFSPKRVCVEEGPVQAASFVTIFQSGFVNTLDIISERTESVAESEETSGSSYTSETVESNSPSRDSSISVEEAADMKNVNDPIERFLEENDNKTDNADYSKKNSCEDAPEVSETDSQLTFGDFNLEDLARLQFRVQKNRLGGVSMDGEL